MMTVNYIRMLFVKIQFVSLLRLPDSMPTKLKIRRMLEIVDTLDLKKCLDTSQNFVQISLHATFLLSLCCLYLLCVAHIEPFQHVGYTCALGRVTRYLESCH